MSHDQKHEQDNQSGEDDSPGKSRVGFPIVGIGASAGGLDVFKRFLTAMPADAGMAFVLVPHLAPGHESLMAPLLARQTEMEVLQVEDNMPLRPNKVYIIPPNRYMRVDDGALRLSESREERPHRAVAAYTDLTELTETQQALAAAKETLEQRVAQRTEQLRRLVAQLGTAEQAERKRIARLLHDDLQQLLASAKLSNDFLRRRVAEGKMRKAADRVEDLLDRAIGAARSLSHNLCPPVLYDRGMCAALRALGSSGKEEFGVDVEVDADPNAEPEEEGVRLLLYSAVRELLLNVAKHAGTDRAWVKMEPAPGDRVRVTVTDRGKGLPSDPVDSDACQDLLFAMRERIEILGGKVDIQSEQGQGTSVILAAPLRAQSYWLEEDQPQDAPEKPPPPAPRPAAAPRSKQAGVVDLLLADDHHMVREGLKGLLENREGIRVVGEATNGREAVEQARTLRPDVIVMDVSMPEMDGIEATRVIHEEFPETVIVGLSMHTDEEVAKALLEAGAAGFVTKDEAPASLVDSIRRFVQERR